MQNFTPNELEILLFRRQFVLGPRFLERFSYWQRTRIGNRLFLQAHPDLELTQIKHRAIELTLLGYLIDPDRPEFGNCDILAELLSQITTARDIFLQTARMGGRWILILDNDRETILFTDPAGLRQVFHTDSSYRQNWCASQPGILAEELGLSFDREAEDNLINSSFFKQNTGYWWPGLKSPYQEIKHLLPNYYLDLRNQTSQRFFPWEKLESTTLAEGAARSASLLARLVKGAHNRFPLALAVTAGTDSRTLLAATREISESVYYYTLVMPSLSVSEENPDIQIPSRLLPRLGLQHHVIESPSFVDLNNDFMKIYKGNVSTAHDAWGAVALGLYNHFPKNRISVNGNVSEIARCFAYQYRYPDRIVPETLASLYHKGMGSNRYTIEAFGEWHREAQSVAKEFNFNILDLFYWENRMGNWLAMAQLEWDIVFEVFSPFNCRELLKTLLSVDMKWRKRTSNFKLYREIIDILWPEVLQQPIESKTTSTRTFLKHIKAKIKSLF